MKYLKILGLSLLLVAALTAVSADASATVLTSPAGTTYTGSVKASIIEGVRIDNMLVEDECPSSSFELKPESHGAAATVKASIPSLSVSACIEGSTVTVLKRGSLEIHTAEKFGVADGTVTWTGAEVTILTHTPLIGTIDCLYQIDGARSGGLLTGSNSTKATAILHTEVFWNKVGGSGLCSKETAWTARYRVTSPDYLDVD